MLCAKSSSAVAESDSKLERREVRSSKAKERTLLRNCRRGWVVFHRFSPVPLNGGSCYCRYASHKACKA